MTESANGHEEFFSVFLDREDVGRERVMNLCSGPATFWSATTSEEAAAAVSKGAEGFSPVLLGGHNGFVDWLATAVMASTDKDSIDVLMEHPLAPAVVWVHGQEAFAAWPVYPRFLVATQDVRGPRVPRKRAWNALADPLLGGATERRWFPVPRGGEGSRLIRFWRGLTYSREDIIASADADPSVVEAIRLMPNAICLDGPESDRRIHREMFVIDMLRKYGVSREGIYSVFSYQPIGWPYRTISAPVDSLLIMDEFARAIADAWTLGVRTGVSMLYEEDTLWFNAYMAAEWWYGVRKGQGGRVLSPAEFTMAARSMSRTRMPGIGFYFDGPSARRFGRTAVDCYGIHIPSAVKAGVIRQSSFNPGGGVVEAV